MPGVLYKIQGFFKASFAGRYLSVLLGELAKNDPNAFADVFARWPNHRRALKNGEAHIETEWRFPGLKKTRIADLAVLIEGHPIILAEIKEDDVNNKENAAQLSDYMRYIKTMKRETFFVHISRYPPASNDQNILEDAKKKKLPVRSIRYRDIHRSLHRSLDAKPKDKRSPYAEMLRDFLEDIGVATYKVLELSKPSDKSVQFFLIQALGFKHAHGLKKSHSKAAVGAVPRVLQTMFDNLETLSDWVKSNNEECFSKQFTNRFFPVQEFNLVALTKALNKAGEEKNKEPFGPLPGTEPGKFVDRGYVRFSSLGAMKNDGPWLNLEFGFDLCLATKSKGRPSKTRSEDGVILSLYAIFNGCGVQDEDYKEFKVFPTEEKVQKELSKLIDSAKKEALGIKSLKAAHRQILKKFKVPTAS